MKIYEYLKIDLTTGEIIEEISYNYDGPLALCDGGGGADGGGGSGVGAGIDPFGSGVGVGIDPFGSGVGAGLGIEGQQAEGAQAEGDTFLKDLAKGLSASTMVTGNPALGVMGGILYAGLKEFSWSGSPSAVGAGPGGFSPGDQPGPGTIMSPGLTAVTPGEETKTSVEAADLEEVKFDEKKRVEERRRKARQRMGYWSTRTTDKDLGPLNIFTPELY